MRRSFFRNSLLLGIAAILVAVYVVSAPVSAQVDTNLAQFQETTGLGGTDIRVTIANIVRVVLGFLGIIAVCLVLYGGFLWMTATGNEDQISKAKKVMINAGIGLLIIMSSFAITQYVLSELQQATGSSIGSGDNGDGVGGVGGSGGSGSGSGGLTSFVVRSVSPRETVPNKNVTIRIVFSEAVAAKDLDKHITVRKNGETSLTPVTVNAQGAVVTVKSQTPCAEAPASFCFAADTQYTIEVVGGKTGVQSVSGKSLLCGVGNDCTARLRTGSVVDVKAPTVTVTAPTAGSLIAQAPSTNIQALVADDLGVSLVEFLVDGAVVDARAVAPSQAGPVTVSSNAWDASGLSLNSSHTVTVRAYDVDDHSTISAAVNVRVVPSYCFDGVQTPNTDEIGKDCSPKGGACGQCDGTCSDNTQCASGTCAVPAAGGDKQCLNLPIITGVSPGAGGEGQWVTVQGKFFGTSGTVSFLNPDGTAAKIVAPLAQCAGASSWTDRAIVLEVPKDLKTGVAYPILVETATASDATNDDRGPRFDGVFMVREQSGPTPGICAITPTAGKVNSTVTVYGKNFSTDAAALKLRFGGVEATLAPRLQQTLIGGQVPNIALGTFAADVLVGAQVSNAVPFTVTGDAFKPAPSILSLSLDKGAVKQYITIKGTNFGEFQNLVKFTRLNDKMIPTGEETYGDFNFPKQCSMLGTWEDTSVVVKVPQIPEGKYHVRVVRSDGDNDPSNNQSNPVVFTVNQDPITPGLCAVVPDNGPTGLAVSLYGDGFGSGPGSVRFQKDSLFTGTAARWTQSVIGATVPSSAVTGEVSVRTEAGVSSNPKIFTVQNCNQKPGVCGGNEQCCGNGACIPRTDAATGKGLSCSSFNVPEASYTFSFFTGKGEYDPNDYPPSVIEECVGGKLPSPTPWIKQPGGDATCVNALMGVKFSIPIAKESLTYDRGRSSTVQLLVCRDAGCAEVDDVSVAIDGTTFNYSDLADSDGSKNSIQSYLSFGPKSPLTPGKTYMVVLSDKITGQMNGMTMVPNPSKCGGTAAAATGAYCYIFKVSETGLSCTLGAVDVSPAKYNVGDPNMISENTKYALSPVPFWETAADGTKTKKYGPLEWSAIGIAKNSKCLLVNACGADSNWSWTSQHTDVGVPAAVPSGSQCKRYVKVTGESAKVVSETGVVTVTPTEITATENTSTLADKSLFTVNYGAPTVLEQCGGSVQSPSPWDKRQGGTAVCVNAIVNVVFSQRMDQSSFGGNPVEIRKCTGTGANPCTTTSEPLSTVFTFKTKDDQHDAVSVALVGNQFFEPATTYRVGVRSTLKGATGVQMEQRAGCATGESYCYSFRTRDEAKACDVDKVQIAPESKTAYALGLVRDKKGSAVPYEAEAVSSDACVLLNANAYQWNWAAQAPYAAVYAVAEQKTYSTLTNSGASQQMWAQLPTTGRPPAQIQVALAGSTKTAESTLAISLLPPTILSNEPACTAACSNVQISATFSQEIDTASLRLGTTFPAVAVLKCTNESCLFPTTADGALTAEAFAAQIPVQLEPQSGVYEDLTTQSGSSYLMALAHETLLPNTYYRVVIRVGDDGVATVDTKGTIAVSSVSEMHRYPAATPAYYSWIFKTRTDGSVCAVSNATLRPKETVVQASGLISEIAVFAQSAGDVCSAGGQTLQASDYSWQWNIANPSVAQFINGTPTDTADATAGGACSARCIAKGTVVAGTPVCGNGVKEQGESCDDANSTSGDGCSNRCLVEPSLRVQLGGTCGDNKVDAGELCDGQPGCNQSTCTWQGAAAGLAVCGNGDIGAGEECDGGPFCTSACLLKGSVAGLAVCGDGTLQPGEDAYCEEFWHANGAKATSSVCTNTCVLRGGLAEANKQGSAYCGNGIVEPQTGEACDDGNALSGDGCSMKCLFEGSATSYAKPSVCGNGSAETGESPSCEIVGASATAGDGKIDATQFVRGLAGGAVSKNNRRETAITAAVAQTNAVASGTYAIQCGYASDSQCPAGAGVGADSCCYARPQVLPETALPVAGSSNVCRNALITIEFNEQIDPASVTTSTVRFFAQSATADACVKTGGTVIAQSRVNPDDPWYRRAWFGMVNTVRGWFDAEPAYAAVNCGYFFDAKLADVQTIQNGSVGVRSKLFITPTELLAEGTEYTVDVTQGVRNMLGVRIAESYKWNFRTGKTLCTLAAVQVEPETHIFTSTGPSSNANLVATALGQQGNALTPIVPTSKYAWAWNWKVTNTERAVVKSQDNSKAVAAPGVKRGATTIRATATVTTDLVSPAPTTGSAYQGFGSLVNANCDVPWPDATTKIGNVPVGFPYTDSQMNFSLWYCRGSLPVASAPTKLLPAFQLYRPTEKVTAGNQLLYSILLRHPAVGDAIGMRIYANPEALSPMDWYAKQGFSGKPTKTSVEGYEAIQDGTTYYIAFVNVAAGSPDVHPRVRNPKYVNIMALSYNPDATAETKAIFAQLLENIRFTTNIDAKWNQGVCAVVAPTGKVTQTTFGSNPARELSCSSTLDCVNNKDNVAVPADVECLSVEQQLNRDTRRLADLNEIKAALTGFKAQYGSAPALGQGTYVPAMAVSTWDSWSTIFGKQIGNSNLPTDPLNAYAKGCDGDPATCWNSSTSKYLCTTGSHVYRYTTEKNTAGYRLGVDLETMQTSAHRWNNTVAGNFQLYGNCVGTPMAPGGICGDGILNLNEQCEAGQKVGVSGGVVDPNAPTCTVPDGKGNTYPGAYAYTCPKTCQYYTAAEIASNKIACQPLGSCGDGVKNGTELCDDGALNGLYNHCAKDCRSTMSAAGRCGDGVLQKDQGEVCDIPRCEYTSISCSVSDAGNTCPVVLNHMESTNYPGYVYLRYGVNGKAQGDTTQLFPKNSVGNSFPIGAQLKCIGAKTVYGKTQAQSCNWDCLSYGPYCGDGVKSGTEKCDGTRTSEEACTTAQGLPGTYAYVCNSTCGSETKTCVAKPIAGGSSSAAAVCGNGVKEGAEACDSGSANGQGCTAVYGGTCQYCSKECKVQSQTGGTCGDGIRQLAEQCDGAELGGKVCKDFVSSSTKNLTCNANCTFNQAACN